MDNSYYTGATLIRAGNTSNNGGPKYLHSHQSSPSTSPPSCHLPPSKGALAGPPLLMQPNLLTGLPLIRNGLPATGNGPGSPGQPPGGHHLTHNHNGHGQPPPPPPGLICCFQPIYYIPATTSPSALYTNHNHSHNPTSVLVNANGNNNNKINNNNNNKPNQNQAPKRKNYKSLTPPAHMGLKPNHVNVNKSPPLPLLTSPSSDPMAQYNYNHPKLSASASFPDPISPPAKQPSYHHHHHTITRTTSSHNHFFASSVESTKSVSLQNEEKQRNDKLLNFYFYDKHWRPRDETDESENSESSQQDNDRSWDFVHQKSSLMKRDQEQELSSSSSSSNSNNSTPTFDKQPGAGRNQFSPSPPTVVLKQQQQQQKDLEVEAQIITLANGHRDLEIRLCYVTS